MRVICKSKIQENNEKGRESRDHTHGQSDKIHKITWVHATY